MLEDLLNLYSAISFLKMWFTFSIIRIMISFVVV